jgi:lipoprotein-anchoring transpeptidase ErfK/SrfK
LPVISVRAFFAAALGAIVVASSAFAPGPAKAEPRVIMAPEYVPERSARARVVERYYDDGPTVRRIIRRNGDEEIYYEEERPRRVPSARERARGGRMSLDGGYDRYDAPRRITRDGDYRVYRYYGDDDFYDPYEPRRIEPMPRRLAGPPSAAGSGEMRRSIDPKFARTTVPYNGSEPANTIVIDTRTRYLYLVQGDGTAIRYGVGVGKQGFSWKGVEKISQKKEWPDWRPPAEMRQRRPELPEFMAGGPDNPLGARALYLGSTLYRIHGSNEPWTIGRAVSSGCIRMTNEDVTDLYDRVGIGTVVKVI